VHEVPSLSSGGRPKAFAFRLRRFFIYIGSPKPRLHAHERVQSLV
jgi:hypothetical protein